MYLTSSSTPLYIMSARSPGVDCRTNAGGGGPGPPLPLTPGLAAAEALAGAVYVVCTPPPGAPHPPPCIACRDLDLLPSDVCPATGCSSCRGWKKAAGPGKIKQKISAEVAGHGGVYCERNTERNTKKHPEIVLPPRKKLFCKLFYKQQKTVRPSGEEGLVRGRAT